MIVYEHVEEMEEIVNAFNKEHTDVWAGMTLDPIDCYIVLNMRSITAGVKRRAVQLVPFYKIEVLNASPKELVETVLGRMYEEFKPNTQTDLYEAIAVVEDWVNRVEGSPRKINMVAAGDEVFESIKIILETAIDKEWV